MNRTSDYFTVFLTLVANCEEMLLGDLRLCGVAGPERQIFRMIQIGEAVLFSSGKKSGMQFPSWSRTRARISTQMPGIIKERK